MYTTIVDMRQGVARCVCMVGAVNCHSSEGKHALAAKPIRLQDRAGQKGPRHSPHTTLLTSTLFTQSRDVCVMLQVYIKLIRPPRAVKWPDASLPRTCVCLYVRMRVRAKRPFPRDECLCPVTVMRWKGCTDRLNYDDPFLGNSMLNT